MSAVRVVLPWTAEIGGASLGAAATFERAIAMADEASRGAPAWVHNDELGEDWFGVAGEWRKLPRFRFGREGARG